MNSLLISGLGGSLFPYLHKQLSDKYNLYYVDSDELLVGLYPDYNFFVAPLVTQHGYIDFIKDIIKKYKIDFYIPLIDEELVLAKAGFDNFQGVQVIAPSVEFSELCLNKFRLMSVLKKRGFSDIKSYMGDDFVWTDEDTVFVKPVSGRGSRGIRKITMPEQLKAYYLLEGYLPEEVLIQEYIEGVEYTIGATVSPSNDLLAVSIKKIIRKKGITQLAVIESNQLLYDLVVKIVEELKPCGPINIQLYLTSQNEVKIFEINPRFSTTTIMSYAGGVDEISLYIDYCSKQLAGIPVQPRDGIILHRRWESIFYEK